MADMTYTKRMSDRREGRLLRTLPAAVRIVPYIRRHRSESCAVLSDSVEVTGIEDWLREKQNEGWAGLSFLHLLIAAYVRTVSMRPGLNRFVADRRLYSRFDIEVVMLVKRGASVSATETSVKVAFAPTDTVFDVYRRLSEAVDEVKADVAVSEAERVAASLSRIPRFLLPPVMGVLRWLDRTDRLPQSWLAASPYHGSLRICDQGSLGILPLEQPLADFGTVSCALSFGAKRRISEGAAERRYVDYKLSFDRRVADDYYFSGAVKCLKYFLKNPKLLELPPENVEEDVN